MIYYATSNNLFCRCTVGRVEDVAMAGLEFGIFLFPSFLHTLIAVSKYF